MILFVILLIISAILFIWQFSNIISIFAGSLYVKTDRELILFALKKADVKKNDIFYDLGSGNGDVLIAAQKFGAKARGVEISPFYYLLSEIRTILNPNIKIIFGNINKVNLTNVDIVYCYLLPKFLKKLKTKFLKEKPKKIISIGFEIPGLPNKKIYHFRDHKVYVYSLRSRSA